MENNNFWISTGLAAARRFAELTVVSCILSAIATILNIAKAVYIRPHVMIMLIVGTLIFLIINIVQMRDCYFDLGDSLKYYVANLIAYGAFGMLSAVVYKISNVAFTWMFGITKFMRYAPFEISALRSLLLFHAICGIAILLAPIGMQKMMDEMEQEMLEEMESMEMFEEGLAQTESKEE